MELIFGVRLHHMTLDDLPNGIMDEVFFYTLFCKCHVWISYRIECMCCYLLDKTSQCKI
ncbi:hypothetical protein RchiOBHm_Chr2g0131821 [Rosa chinensis]|uniref:Uncharacterized protein n=1 Tax=Rosa chinensis TaxID=74649 RepID=A0A2P6RV56_ROSCH|nr:hypothetical protein RchiOBHm_Chr2g0131821 [Rosa chinensis]